MRSRGIHNQVQKTSYCTQEGHYLHRVEVDSPVVTAWCEEFWVIDVSLHTLGGKAARAWDKVMRCQSGAEIMRQ